MGALLGNGIGNMISMLYYNNYVNATVEGLVVILVAIAAGIDFQRKVTPITKKEPLGSS